ncbi:MAG: aldehyde dehydrogenase family protein [bacterium]
MSTHASLQRGPSNWIGGEWRAIPGDAVVSRNPSEPGKVVYSSAAPVSAVAEAVAAARKALGAWSAWPREKRFEVLRGFAEITKKRAGAMAELLCDEVGKVMWECKGEAGLLASKVDITLDSAPEGGLRRVSDFEFKLSASRTGRCVFKPHGVVAVLGPFNFPAHLPNGHIVPALAAGNTVVFKPSDKAPGVGQMLAEMLDEALRAAGAPAGVVNLVQGGAEVASALAGGEGVDAVAFTGSWGVGRRILQANLDRPGRIVALELGGSNPAVVMGDADLKLAATEIVRCAFNTTGQRCTCTRRAIVHRSVADRLIPAICKATSNLIIGHPRAGHPVFMGPLVSEASRRAMLQFQSRAAAGGAEVLVAGREVETPTGGWFVSPSVLKVERFNAAPAPEVGAGALHAVDPGCDEEVFGPLLRIAVVESLDEAIAQANATRYGLAASIFTADAAAGERFVREVRAGCINVNAGTAGASSKLPFGGLGLSGNHRPAGSFALDYCAYPVASMVETGNAITAAEGMRFEDSWLG